MRILLDAGALIAVDRGDRAVGALLQAAREAKLAVLTSPMVVAAVWRGGAAQARLARVLAGVETRPVDVEEARRAGQLLGRSRTTDVVDAHLALLARPEDRVLTSDPEDIAMLLEARGVRAVVLRV